MEPATAERTSLTSQLSYWKERLGDARAVLELPTDRPRQAAPRSPVKAATFALPAPLSPLLDELGRHEHGSPFTVLLAAFQVLLYRYTGHEDMLIGTPVSLTSGAVNTLALRTDLSGDPTFRQLLGRVRQVVQDAHAHQDLPFDRLVEELVVGQPGNAHPLFRVMFALRQDPEAVGCHGDDGHVTSAISAPECVELAQNDHWGDVELRLTIEEAGRQLTGTFE